MSKAFTREEDIPDPTVTRRPVSTPPAGMKNYLTADGARRLREELDRLLEVERPRTAASADPTLAREQLQALDLRIAQLQESLQSAVIVNPQAGPAERVRFGATVAVRDRDGEESRYRIVGVDEIDVDRGWVSWVSPIARALLNARSGDRVRLKLPTGEKELEVVSVAYE